MRNTVTFDGVPVKSQKTWKIEIDTNSTQYINYLEGKINYDS